MIYCDTPTLHAIARAEQPVLRRFLKLSLRRVTCQQDTNGHTTWQLLTREHVTLTITIRPTKPSTPVAYEDASAIIKLRNGSYARIDVVGGAA